ncbi:hypothetical protein MPF19_10510 [Polaribacter sp. Z014]|uniref:hypothetical protein n=1 Tax=unclassified Polaribacter TaxID=196858 RepID=UPI00193AF6DD|nr:MULTISPECIES: hypothetical protein [unclassified Polaribacter]MCL7763849.1 hypothetical protein [Polaribacter sp. Z014]QVY66496.1 hypothetical protein JOP69_04190 [Polaribacter sp. Q13]
MDIQTTKIALIKEILDIENPETLLKIRNIIDESNFDINTVNENNIDYDNLKPSLQKRKLAFITDFINLENEETISKLEKSLSQNNDFWNDLSLSEKEEIEQGIKELDEGKRVSYESVLNEVS